jgi:hypothetical protein
VILSTFLNYVNCPLYDVPYYSYSVILEDNTFTLRFVYNDILKLYTLTILDDQGYILCSGIGITPYHPMTIDYDLRGLTGFFQLLPIGDNGVEYYKDYPESLSKYYRLYYYSEIK